MSKLRQCGSPWGVMVHEQAASWPETWCPTPLAPRIGCTLSAQGVERLAGWLCAAPLSSPPSCPPSTGCLCSILMCLQTNCLAPLAKVVDDAFGIKEGLMTTVSGSPRCSCVGD